MALSEAWRSTCAQDGCTGHLGKFQSCLAEAVWEGTLDGPDAETGRTEAHGHYALMVYSADDQVWLQDGVVVTIPAGAYMVESTESGAVYLHTYDSEAAARAAFDEADRAYSAWEDANGDG